MYIVDGIGKIVKTKGCFQSPAEIIECLLRADTKHKILDTVLEYVGKNDIKSYTVEGSKLTIITRGTKEGIPESELEDCDTFPTFEIQYACLLRKLVAETWMAQK